MQTILRYPGGKFKKGKNIIQHFHDTSLDLIEPMCGGAGVSLVYANMNRNAEIILSDINELVTSFWYVIVNNVQGICDRLESEMTVDIYKKYHEMEPVTIEDEAIKFFVLNKCSFNGYVGEGSVPIGGWEQKSQWKVNWAWKPEKLQKNIMIIHEILKNRTTVFSASVFEMIGIFGDRANLNWYMDAPYIDKGEAVYGEYGQFDHQKLAQDIKKIKGCVIISYDYHPLVRELYPDYRYEELNVFSSRRYIDKEKSKCLKQKEYLIIKDKE